MDILLGTFIEKYLDELDESQLEEYERILSLDDVFIYDCYQGRSHIPNDLPLLRKMIQTKLD